MSHLRILAGILSFIAGSSVVTAASRTECVGGAGDRLVSIGGTTSHLTVDLVSGIVVSAR